MVFKSFVHICLIVLAALLADPAAAQKKHAFVVGIDRYDNLPAGAQLKKAVGDATEMSKTLGGLGFTVMQVKEPTRGEFVAKWYQFLQRVRPGDTIAFVFSGHGVELEGANFLLPRDVPRVRSGREGQLRSESLSFGQLLTDMRERQAAFSFIVLDACRDNPFEEGGRTVGGRRGLGRVEALEGTFVMFSAGAGQTALDRLDASDKAPTSIFTRTLVPLMRTPGLSLLDMADQVGEQVRALARTVGHNQTPAFYSRVIGGRKVCLAGCERAPETSAPSDPIGSAVETVRVCREVATMTSLTMLSVLERQYAGTPTADCISARKGELNTETKRKWEAFKLRFEKPAVGTVFRDCPECPEMVVVPAGSFTMGSPENHSVFFADERPQHTVTIHQPFAVGKFEITFDDWGACVAGGGCDSNKGPSDSGLGTGRRPVINVSWDDAQQYVAWLSRRTGKTYRLLSEAEWEHAARAGTTTEYFWGDTFSSTRANGDKGRTVEVGQYDANFWGLYDMHGNVWEWVEDCWHDSYKGAPDNGSAWTTACTDGSRRVLRGGSWDYNPRNLRSAVRDRDWANGRSSVIGFRVGRTL